MPAQARRPARPGPGRADREAQAVGFIIGLGEAGVAVLVFLGIVLGLRSVLSKKAPEGNSNDITNGETLL